MIHIFLLKLRLFNILLSLGPLELEFRCTSSFSTWRRLVRHKNRKRTELNIHPSNFCAVHLTCAKINLKYQTSIIQFRPLWYLDICKLHHISTNWNWSLKFLNKRACPDGYNWLAWKPWYLLHSARPSFFSALKLKLAPCTAHHALQCTEVQLQWSPVQWTVFYCDLAGWLRPSFVLLNSIVLYYNRLHLLHWRWTILCFYD